jgi:hypothetical protein
MREPAGRRDQQMPRSYPPEMRRQIVELARAGTKVKQLAADVSDVRRDDL